MKALFADTFYWIALADAAHIQALALTRERGASNLVTTDEVLTEYLTFFSTAHEQLRRLAAESVESRFSPDCSSIKPGRTRATA